MYDPKNVADLETDSSFLSKTADNQWLCYDFKDMRVVVTRYTLRSHTNAKDTNHLRAWAIEGSEDGEQWTEIDRQEDDASLNGPKAIGSFEVRNVMECKCVRIKSIGQAWGGTKSMYFGAFELFGGLRAPHSVKLM
jgi:hypothetical protein